VSETEIPTPQTPNVQLSAMAYANGGGKASSSKGLIEIGGRHGPYRAFAPSIVVPVHDDDARPGRKRLGVTSGLRGRITESRFNDRERPQ